MNIISIINIIINFIILVVLSVFIFHIYWIKDNKEPMTNVSNDIKEAVKQVYVADVESIRNLSEVAKTVQADGLTVPAHANIRGRMNIGSNTNAKDLPDWLGLSVENAGDAHIRLKTKADDNKNVYLIDRDGNFRVNTHGIGDMFGVNKDGHTYNTSTSDNVHNFISRGDNPYISLSKEGEWGGKSWYMQNVKNDGTNKIFRIGVHDEGSKLDIHKNGNAFFTGDINGSKNVNVGGQLDVKGQLNVNGQLTVDGVKLDANILKRIINQQQYAGFAIDGGGSTMLLFEGDHVLYGDTQFNAWTNDAWNIIYINRGWRITLWHHEIGNGR